MILNRICSLLLFCAIPNELKPKGNLVLCHHLYGCSFHHTKTCVVCLLIREPSHHWFSLNIQVLMEPQSQYVLLQWKILIIRTIKVVMCGCRSSEGQRTKPQELLKLSKTLTVAGFTLHPVQISIKSQVAQLLIG